jgi:hypothetical protein
MLMSAEQAKYTLIQSVFSYSTNKRRPDSLMSFIRLAKSYCHCDRFYSSCYRLLNLPDTRHEATLAERRVERWSLLISHAGEKQPIVFSGV